MAEVVVAGHICLDVIPRLGKGADIVPGKLVEVGAADITTGGCVANVGRALHGLGVGVRLVGKIGDDPFGGLLTGVLAREGLAGGLVEAKGGVTSYSIVISPPGADRTFLHAPGCNATFTASDVPEEALAGARLFHFGYPPLMAATFANEGAELEAILRKAKEAGLTTSLDMSLPDPESPSGHAPWRRILERVLPLVDVFLPSQDELAFMLGLSEGMAEICLDMGAGAVVIKRGEQGLLARCGDRGIWPGQRAEQACFPVEVVGTTGSGDATIAGFLMGLLRGMSLKECLIAGCAVGAHSVEATDAVSGIRSWPETSARWR
ncbi:hypothetical protein BH11ARM2_BH11ARM2_36110 [soil metagenome]